MANTTVLSVDKGNPRAFQSVSEALGAATGYYGLPVEIRVARGTYRERITVSQPLITLTGEDAANTVIVYGDGAFEILADGVKRGTFRTATAMVTGDGFRASGITFENDAGRGDDVGQAIALYVDADRVTVERCRILGRQDTLFAAPLPPAAIEKGGLTGPRERFPRRVGTHRYADCLIAGDVDFIFGGARAFFERCEIFSRDCGKPVKGFVAAPCTPEGEEFGFVFRSCRFTGDCAPGTVYLGRPWRDYAKVAVIDCELGAHIHPEGFHDWSKPLARATAEFVEWRNRGPGSSPASRAPFVREIGDVEADRYSRERCLGARWEY